MVIRAFHLYIPQKLWLYTKKHIRTDLVVVAHESVPQIRVNYLND